MKTDPMDDAVSYAVLALYRKSRREPISDDLAKSVISRSIATWKARNAPKTVSLEDLRLQGEDGDENDWEPPTMTDFTTVEVEEFFESLPERQMQVARMLFEKETPAEIARSLGITPQAVDDLVKKLRKRLEEW